MARGRDHAAAVDAIYAAAIEPANWPDALAALCRVCAAESASYNLQHVTHSVGTRIAFGYEGANQPRYYENGFATRNPLFKGLLNQPAGVPYRHQALVDDDAFRRGVYFNEYCRPNGLHFMAGLVIARRGEIAEWISLNRGPHGAPYGRRQLDAVAQLAPHLRCASETARRLAEAHAIRASWEAALDQLRFGIVLLDGHARVVFANQAARRMDAARDGLTLRRAGLAASNNADAVARAVDQAIQGGSDGIRHGVRLVLPRCGSACPLSALVIPLPREPDRDWPGRPAAMMLLADPAQPARVDQEHIQDAFGLTGREAALAALLVSGQRLGTAATTLGIGHETARTHLARVLGKTGTERQADLVRLLLAAALPI